MATTHILDPQAILRAYDAEVNAPTTTRGAEDIINKGDYVKVSANDTLRQVSLTARNENETGDAIPLVASPVGDFISCYVEQSDFGEYDSGDDWIETAATTGTATQIAGENGVLELDSGSSTADQGIQIQRRNAAWKLTAGKKHIFAARFKITDTIDKAQVFAGFSVLDTSFFSAGEPSASDYIGFLIDATKQGGADAGKADFELYDGVTAERTANAVTFVEDTYKIVGFVVDGVTTATPFTMTDAGVVTFGTAIAIADVPDSLMTTTFACLSEGTNDPIVTLDWYYGWKTR